MPGTVAQAAAGTGLLVVCKLSAEKGCLVATNGTTSVVGRSITGRRIVV